MELEEIEKIISEDNQSEDNQSEDNDEVLNIEKEVDSDLVSTLLKRIDTLIDSNLKLAGEIEKIKQEERVLFTEKEKEHLFNLLEQIVNFTGIEHKVKISFEDSAFDIIASRLQQNVDKNYMQYIKKIEQEIQSQINTFTYRLGKKV